MAAFKKITQTKKQLFFVIISANGIKKTIYSEEIVNGLVTLDDSMRQKGTIGGIPIAIKFP